MSIGSVRTPRWRRRWKPGLATAVVATFGGVLVNRNSGKAVEVQAK